LLVLRIFNLGQLLNFFWRPIVATAVMAIFVLSIDLSAPPIVALSLRVITGLAVFPLVLVVLWNFSGRPNGLETAIIALLYDYTRTAPSRQLRK
jgi:hypothetical protein